MVLTQKGLDLISEMKSGFQIVIALLVLAKNLSLLTIFVY